MPGKRRGKKHTKSAAAAPSNVTKAPSKESIALARKRDKLVATMMRKLSTALNLVTRTTGEGDEKRKMTDSLEELISDIAILQKPIDALVKAQKACCGPTTSAPTATSWAKPALCSSGIEILGAPWRG